MGGRYAAEKDAREVTVSSFFLDRDEVTVAAYAMCVRSGACAAVETRIAPSSAPWLADMIALDACNGSRDDRVRHPVNCVTWNQARAFCAWAEKRLPSEAEWEYAAGGANRWSYPWGGVEFEDDMQPGFVSACGRECPLAGKGLAYEDAFPTTAPVGSFPAGTSPSGIDDLAGNVWEWVADPYCPYDGKSPCRSEHVIRGGGWSDPLTTPMDPRIHFTRTKRGDPDIPDGIPVDDWGIPTVGFRCARSAR
jgi:formylglycine-generating enzyme required for sulfatase activity